MHNQIERINIDEEHFTEANHPFTIKPNFSCLGNMIEISFQGPLLSFIPHDSMRNLLGFSATTLYEDYNTSPNRVDNLSFNKFFLKSDFAQGTIFKGKTSGTIHDFTMDVNLG